jgi:hypothetical protein
MAIPEDRYSPDPAPAKKIPKRMADREWLKPVKMKTIPVPTADSTMVFRCRIREETNPEKNRTMQYPVAEKRKKDPA